MNRNESQLKEMKKTIVKNEKVVNEAFLNKEKYDKLK